MEMRNHVVAPQERTIECPGTLHQAFAGGCGDDELDQFIDHRIVDTNKVPRPDGLGGLAAPIIALLVARRQGLTPGPDDHVVVTGVSAVLILGAVHDANFRVDSEAFQIARKRQCHPLESGLDQQDFEVEGRAGLGVGEVSVADHPAGILQQLLGRA